VNDVTQAEFINDIKWIREHSQKLQEKYPDMYVAVYKGKVVAADKEFRKVCEKTRSLGEKAIIKYVFSGDLVVL
jgi:hypothetical protein